MIDTVILFISIVLFIAAHEFIRKSAMRHIQESNCADESCFYRKKFLRLRLIAVIIFASVAIYVVVSGHNTGVNSGMVVLVLLWSSYINKHSLPLSGMRPKDMTQANFILYLRGFASDDYSLTQKDLGKLNVKLSTFSEGSFINILKQYMPVYAVGMTKELNSPIGAKRIYLDDEEWESEVLELMTRASLIVILLNDTPSCIWEICKSNQFKNKTVFISNDTEKVANIRKELNKQSVYLLPTGLKGQTISYFIEDGNELIISGYSNTEKSYKQIIKELMFKKFGLTRFVLTQKNMTLMLVILYIAVSILLYCVLFL